MKQSHSANYSFFKPGAAEARPKRPPLRTVAELAAEFGVSTMSLAGLMGKDRSAPQSKVKSAHATYYDPAEVRAWWTARKASK